MKGKVYLVGAGPGDYKLLTLKGLECIKKADVIVYDRLANKDYLKEAKENCEFIYVGKASSNHTLPQDDINMVIVNKAKEGKVVTRLKGGDPYVFGRGGEEGEVLREEGIEFEVVPGITSALAAAAYAGIPATHRDYCASVHIITGHRKRNAALEMDFDALVRMNGTLIFLMAVATFGEIAQGLIGAGMAEEYPCAIVENGTRPEQRRLLTTVGQAAACIEENRVKSPAIFVVGRVCELSERMDWFDVLPLKGKRVIAPKPKPDSHRLADLLREMGARVMELPAPSAEYLPFELPEEGTNIFFSDAESVNALFAQLKRSECDARALAGYALVCETKEGQKALMERGLIPDAPRHERASLCLGCEGGTGLPVWRRILPEKIAQIDADYVAFTTLSCVDAFARVAEGWDLSGLTAVCIGEQTADAARKLGLKVIQSAEKSIESMAEAML